MARKKRSAASPISIGNCKVEIDGDDYACELIDEGFLISVSNGATIKISIDDSRKTYGRRLHDNGSKRFPLEDYSFMLLNAKDGDSDTKSLLQEVLKIYTEQLPAMNYAANTGKESHFLEKCISSGKYKTLILKSNWTEGLRKVIAAISYQIIPADTQYAEVPLAAVCSNYQSKGVGHLMYTELKERLQSVGISTILCWADKVSEGFWFKQGFISIGEVDGKGRARKLPIKNDIRGALCFPGGSTLMVAHLNMYTMASVNFSEHSKSCSFSEFHAKSYKCFSGQMESGKNEALVSLNEDEPQTVFRQVESTQCQHFVNDSYSTDGQKFKDFPASTIMFPCCGCSLLCTNGICDRARVDPDATVNGNNSSSSQRLKRHVWEASISSLKSKRIRGCPCIDDCQENHELNSERVREIDVPYKDCSLGTSGCQKLEEVIPRDTAGQSKTLAEGRLAGPLTMDVETEGNCPRIMFMNIADDSKKTCLTKIVGELGGSVTCNGSLSTHVITGKSRKTLNFCIALCSGAWIISPQWLKESFREGKFLGESPFILQDDEYLLKYKLELKDAVMRAKLNPNSLLKGYYVCLAKHIQPSADVLSPIIKASGGSVIRKLQGIKEPSKAIFLACEEDMEDAMVAAKKGVWTFSSEWFMSCVMKQELDSLRGKMVVSVTIKEGCTTIFL